MDKKAIAEKDQAREQAREQAAAWLASIIEMVHELDQANRLEVSGVNTAYDGAIEKIITSPLSVEVRSGWYEAGAGQSARNASRAAEFKILLSTGGPAVQIVGDLAEGGEPERAWLQYQDWGTLWTVYPLDQKEEDALLDFARQFYFGE